ncbi:MAG TPA: hypothetical protein P5279_17860 [Anaerohalosphaeraceae bacterium]|nr:hypothetical protein [Anaerohalosphaeraceae bacterium]
MDANEQQNQGQTGDTGAGGGDAKWYDSLPDDIKGNDAIKGFDGVESLAKAHLTTQAQLAELQAKVPVVPGKPEEYGLPDKFEGLPDDFIKAESAKFADFAHKHGLTKEQALGLFQAMAADERDSLTAAEAEIARAAKETEAMLVKEYGDKKQEKVTAGAKALVKIAEGAGIKAEDFTAMLNATGIGDNPLLIRMSVKLADLISSDVFERSFTGGGVERTTAEILYPTMKKGE